MNLVYNLYNLQSSFRESLIAENISPLTLKNYLSDYRHFVGWLYQESRTKNQELRIKDINAEVINSYKIYLIDNNLPIKTINRRLSTLRKFCSFCILQGWMKENPAKKILNVKSQILNLNQDQIIKQFNNYLLKQNIDQKTITNYLDDVKEFLSL